MPLRLHENRATLLSHVSAALEVVFVVVFCLIRPLRTLLEVICVCVSDFSYPPHLEVLYTNGLFVTLLVPVVLHPPVSLDFFLYLL
jgi:hypothetical protein